MVLERAVGPGFCGEWLTQRYPGPGRFTTSPNHPGNTPEGTLRAILKQAGIEPDVFLQKK